MIELDIKKDFPIFKSCPELVYLDSPATALKPQVLIDAIRHYYEDYGVSVHRGLYSLAEQATSEFDGAREKVRVFLNAQAAEEIIFVRNATEAINLVAQTWGRSNISENDLVLVSAMEHHSNIVPWQMIKGVTGSKEVKDVKGVEYFSLTDDYKVDIADYKKKLESGQVKLVAITHASNVLGTINPVKEMIKLAHLAGAKVLVDGAQAAAYMRIDVTDLDADFYVFSGHKMMGPMGIGVLYGKQELLEAMPPYMGGGGMITRVGEVVTEWLGLPDKFEAGTPNVAGVIGLGRAIDYLQALGFDQIEKHEQALGKYALEKLKDVKGLTLYGPKDMKDRLAIFPFSLLHIHAHDIATILSDDQIAVRAGHHCTMPLHTDVLKVSATARASFYIYNTKADVDKLVESLEKIIKKFK